MSSCCGSSSDLTCWPGDGGGRLSHTTESLHDHVCSNLPETCEPGDHLRSERERERVRKREPPPLLLTQLSSSLIVLHSFLQVLRNSLAMLVHTAWAIASLTAQQHSFTTHLVHCRPLPHNSETLPATQTHTSPPQVESCYLIG